MKRNHLLSALLAAWLLYLVPLNNQAATITLIATAKDYYYGSSKTLNLSSNDIATVLFIGGDNTSAESLWVDKDGANIEMSMPMQQLPVIAGPAKIWLRIRGSGGTGNDYSSFCTVQVTRQTESFVPSSSVVIPADSGGPVKIILESSVDLINWIMANPGTYGTSTTNRFFRVRAER